MAHTVRFIAERKGVELSELCGVLEANATAVFGEWGDGVAHG
jgi:Tat protein secretion system quality control protein TatD with DNase activity